VGGKVVMDKEFANIRHKPYGKGWRLLRKHILKIRENKCELETVHLLGHCSRYTDKLSVHHNWYWAKAIHPEDWWKDKCYFLPFVKAYKLASEKRFDELTKHLEEYPLLFIVLCPHHHIQMEWRGPEALYDALRYCKWKAEK